MLDRLIGSQMAAVALIFFVIVMVWIYLLNRERAKVQQIRGPRRFRPKWRERSGDRVSVRRRRRKDGFHPAWSERETHADAGSEEISEGAGSDESPPSAG